MNYRNLTILFLAAFAVFRAVYVQITPLDLSPDEAHYWEWSRRLDMSYYSKGPAVAYVIAFFTGIFGNTDLGVRIGAIIFSFMASIFIFLIGRDFFKSEKAGFYSALIANIVPVFSIGSIVMTTDIILIAFWAAAVYSFKLALDKKSSFYWLLTGALVGMGFLGKYTMVLLYPSLLLYILYSNEDRSWLKKPAPYVAGLLSLIIALPVILWNIKYGQVTIKHTMGQAHVGRSIMDIGGFFEFLGAQFGLLSPLIFIAVLYGVWACAKKGFKDKGRGELISFFASAPLLLFFLLLSFRGKVQANWAVASYVTALPAAVWAFASLFERSGSRRLLKNLAVLAIFMSAAMTTIIFSPWLLSSFGAEKVLAKPPFDRVIGWEALGKKASQAKSRLEKTAPAFVLSDAYQITSELAFYMEGNPIAYNLANGRRMNQYDLWPGFEGLLGYNAVYVKAGNTQAPELNGVFDRCEKEFFTTYLGGAPVNEYSIFSCYNFKGLPKSEIRTF